MNYDSRFNKAVMAGEQEYILEIYEKVSDIDKNYINEINLNKNFVNTLEMLK